MLNERLRELREAGIVELAQDGEAGGFHFTEHGEALLKSLAPLATWAAAWAKRA